MSTIEDVLEWAEPKGVQLFSVKPRDIPGHGTGIVATRDLKEGETLMDIPIEGMRSLHSVPKEISDKLSSDASIHSRLAADLTLNAESANWVKLAPSWTDLEATMPYMWPEELQELLPREARNVLADQQSHFQGDWQLFSQAFPEGDMQKYLHAWFLVATRSFYYEDQNMLLFPWHDRLALLPVADLFNHSTRGCNVSFSTEGYTITADRRYMEGDEIFTSYGRHSNDFLLAEYGFVLKENEWDGVSLDDVILQRLNTKQKDELKGKGLLGGYMLSSSNLQECDNTVIALRLLCSEEPQWQSFIDGEEDGGNTKAEAKKLLLTLLGQFQDDIKEVQRRIENLKVGSERQRGLLVQRWKQIEAVVEQALSKRHNVAK